MRKISLDQLNRLFATIAGERTLYLPVDTENGAKYEKWESENPDWNKVMLIPVATEYTTTANSYGQTVKQLLRVRNELSLRSAKLEGGDDNLEMTVVYSRFTK